MAKYDSGRSLNHKQEEFVLVKEKSFMEQIADTLKAQGINASVCPRLKLNYVRGK
ncbi:hypothetical protein [Amphibacillus sediminis]|uniref:hypothetical protein n=1 Tax=Amphibacillus sediminis TaxID=360185 RepID=UPI0012ECF362|nr:hypothetical protein [Amphibacillus sediminis]